MGAESFTMGKSFTLFARARAADPEGAVRASDRGACPAGLGFQPAGQTRGFTWRG
jgi:hypothetical protein